MIFPFSIYSSSVLPCCSYIVWTRKFSFCVVSSSLPLELCSVLYNSQSNVISLFSYFCTRMQKNISHQTVLNECELLFCLSVRHFRNNFRLPRKNTAALAPNGANCTSFIYLRINSNPTHILLNVSPYHRTHSRLAEKEIILVLQSIFAIPTVCNFNRSQIFLFFHKSQETYSEFVPP